MVGGPVWLKFELLLDIMHVLYTYEFKMDQINSNPEKVATSFFLDAQGQLHVTPWSVVRSGRILDSFKLLCIMASLPANLKRI